MRLGYAKQYGIPCVIIEADDTAEEVMGMADDEGAIFYDGPDPVEDKCFCVKFSDRPKELYTSSALKRSL